MKFYIDPDIHKANTLPSQFYTVRKFFDQSKEQVFARSWQFVADRGAVFGEQNLFPFTFLPGSVEEPLLLTHTSEGRMRVLSNVCTHRGNILCPQPARASTIRCGYHGRRFDLSGCCKGMPAFGDVKDFPGPKDDLASMPVATFGNMLFTSLEPSYPADRLFAPIMDRLFWFPLEQLVFDPDRSKTYEVKAHWALYVDNYLEGFHIPFVHPALNASLDIPSYEYECYPLGVLQIGEASSEEPSFTLPDNSPDSGRRIFAYYYWVFPNMMFNFYPWGLSFNWVQPLNHHTTRVIFRTYLLPDQEEAWAASQLDATELEDEEVVEQVQQGIQSRFYDRGRYSPTQEQGVHHFHRLIAAFMSDER